MASLPYLIKLVLASLPKDLEPHARFVLSSLDSLCGIHSYGFVEMCSVVVFFQVGFGMLKLQLVLSPITTSYLER